MSITLPAARTLTQRLDQDGVICAEGYLFEMERRGYLQAGTFVPEVALENPWILEGLHREFMHAGSDVLVAFTYNGHREKLRVVGKEHLLEPLNRAALELAKKVALEAGDVEGLERPLVAGNISNTNIYDPDDAKSSNTVRGMYEEMVGWAVDAGVDMMVAETHYYLGEAEIALRAVKDAGLPAVVTLGVMGEGLLWDGAAPAEACKHLEDQGADVVGLNCFRGPETMLPMLRDVREAVEGHVAALPVPYRTTREHPTFFHLPDPGNTAKIPHKTTFPTALDPLACNRYEMGDFARQALELGIRYIGICCGCTPAQVRSVAEALGRTPPASRFSPDMSKQFLFGDDPELAKHVTAYRDKA